MIGDPYNFQVYTPQNFVYEIPAYILLPRLDELKVTIEPFIANQPEINSQYVSYKNVKVYAGQNPYKRLTLTQIKENTFKVKWTNLNPNNREEIGYSDGTGVIDEKEYQQYYYQQQIYLNFKDDIALQNNIPTDTNAFDIYDRIQKIEQIVEKSITIYSEIIDTLQYLQNNEEQLDSNSVSAIIDNIVGILTETGSSGGASWPIDNSLIKYYEIIYEYYLNNLKIVLQGTNEDNIPQMNKYNNIYQDQIIVNLLQEANIYLYNFKFESTTDQRVYDNTIIPLVNKIENLRSNYSYLVGDVYSESSDPNINLYMSILYEKLLKYWQDNYKPNEQLFQLVDLTEYDNKYCIYWFKNNKNAEDDQAGKGWEQIEDSLNKGISTSIVEGGIQLNKDPKQYENIYTLPNVVKGNKIKAILYFNHIPYIAETYI